MCQASFDPFRREVIEVASGDVLRAAETGDEIAIQVNDEMRRQNRGYVFVLARSGDCALRLALEELKVSHDFGFGDGYEYEAGHA